MSWRNSILSPDGGSQREQIQEIKTLVQIKMLPSQAQHFLQVPFSNDISIVITIFIKLGFKDFLNIKMDTNFKDKLTLIQPVVWSFMGQFGDIFVIVLVLMVSIIIFCILPILIRFEQFNHRQIIVEVFLLSCQLINCTYTLCSSVYQTINLKLELCISFPIFGNHSNYHFINTDYKMEMDKHMAKGQDWIMLLKDQPEQYDSVKRRVEGLLRGFVIVAYQLLSRIAIPFLLYMILLLKNSQIPETNIRYNYLPANYDVNEQYCVKENIVMTDLLFEDKDDPVEDLNSDPSKIIMKRITQYGIFTKSFIYTFIEFYYFISSLKQTQKKKKQ
ncbi:unnamed protein product [Paramecium octaurelia]|uniref:Uncharacterized protein n=1 Tax=Paramecium octaurelia TaxID=43137 RepID=A0A8S1UIM5_PAROT|nr:unnamed protein product [Paramecium octaurelia]